MRFRTTTQSNKTILNLAGGKAYGITPEEEFLFAVLSSFLQDKFYESADEQVDRLRRLICEIPDKQFIAKVALFARNEFGMRSVSHLIAGELPLHIQNETWVKQAIFKIIRRPDDILEIVAYYFNLTRNVGYKKGLPASLRKGIQLSLAKFDEYQLAKYQGSNSNVKMIDILNLIHPKPTDFNKDTFQKLINQELRSENTWESELSDAGQTNNDEESVSELKSIAWEKLILEKRLGYFALLKNLRNIIQDCPGSIDAALELLINENLIKKSLVLPFRYIKAIEQIEKVSSKHSAKVIVALNKAAEIALCNVPTFKGTTLVALDISGSMAGLPITIGSLFAAALVKNNDADLMLFSETADYYVPNTQDGLLSIAHVIKSKATYGGTNFHSIFLGSKIQYTRIIILSDMQAWINADVSLLQTLASYKKKYRADPFIYSFDLNGYGPLQFPSERVFCLAGFSDKTFDVMKSLETDGARLIDVVNSIVL